ncbi:hypothetical protein VTN00DRAFT_4079 [Thermoascus crustaceus]|uniref:uncharacterized protein n=1 Tax=Thermoascus crustaceus TaxID=5088 RepID=UPI0037437B4B
MKRFHGPHACSLLPVKELSRASTVSFVCALADTGLHLGAFPGLQLVQPLRSLYSLLVGWQWFHFSLRFTNLLTLDHLYKLLNPEPAIVSSDCCCILL